MGECEPEPRPPLSSSTSPLPCLNLAFSTSVVCESRRASQLPGGLVKSQITGLHPLSF